MQDQVTQEVLRFKRERLKELSFMAGCGGVLGEHQSGKFVGMFTEIKQFIEMAYEDLYPDDLENHMAKMIEIERLFK